MEDLPSDTPPPSPPQTVPPEVLAAIHDLKAKLREELDKCAKLRAEVERLVAQRTSRRRRHRKTRSGSFKH